MLRIWGQEEGKGVGEKDGGVATLVIWDDVAFVGCICWKGELKRDEQL